MVLHRGTGEDPGLYRADVEVGFDDGAVISVGGTWTNAVTDEMGPVVLAP